MYFVAKNLKKKHNITNERAALYEAAETWVDALKGRKFLGMFNWQHNVVKLTEYGIFKNWLWYFSTWTGGSNPNLADLAVFGVLRPIRHLKSGKDMVQHTRIGDWYTGMENVVGESSRIKA